MYNAQKTHHTVANMTGGFPRQKIINTGLG